MALDLTSVYRGMLNFNLWWVFWVVIGAGVIYLIISMIRHKIIYRYPVRIFKTRENGGVKESNHKGGYIKRKNSASFFQIKSGRMPWQKINLNTTPNPAYMDQDNRVYYKQIDLNSYIQLKRIFTKDVEEFLPVEQDIQYGAILDIHRIDKVLETESPWKKIVPYIALVILFVFGIVGWWMVMQSKCPA